MEVNTIDDLLLTIKEKEVYIYGTGLVSERFSKALIRKGLFSNIKSYIVTHRTETLWCNNKRILELDEFCDDNSLICIAVHESIKNEIEHELDMRNVKNYVWIYPFLFELILGNCKKNQKISVSDVWKCNRDYLSIAIRYAALEELYGNSTIGYSVYQKGLSMFCLPSSVDKRLESFINLAKKWEIEGYNSSYPSILMSDYFCLDGTHRFALACYHKLQYINADIYYDYDNLDILCQKGVFIKRNEVKEEFGLEEKEYLEDIVKKIDSNILK
ncbi:MAG: hypothetical protein ACI4AQ_10570 [Lachnospiraceae bacterium]